MWDFRFQSYKRFKKRLFSSKLLEATFQVWIRLQYKTAGFLFFIVKEDAKKTDNSFWVILIENKFWRGQASLTDDFI